jgi:hypothetical protein
MAKRISALLKQYGRVIFKKAKSIVKGSCYIGNTPTPYKLANPLVSLKNPAKVIELVRRD